ncbi:MAG: hypothetical protein HRU70_13205 [Phycisphaeraceae bacterium]|nr:MAG: hypothetical protein HRU70_13205 [Phycisphaeraceae bacterium]
MTGCVLLEHRLPDGSEHFDWMIEPGGDAEGLVTFRVMERIDTATGGRFPATRLPPHREAYLDYQGPVSGGRGQVRRVARGTARIEHHGEGLFVVLADWGGGAVRYEGRSIGDDEWAFTVTRAG